MCVYMCMYIYIYIKPNHFAVHLSLTQYCESTKLQFYFHFKKEFKKNLLISCGTQDL